MAGMATTAVQKHLVSARRRRQIKDANRRFAKLSDDEKRITIVRDVLLQLSTKMIRPKFKSWVFWASKIQAPSDTDLSLTTQIADQPCTGCAIGAMFVCAVRRANDLCVGAISQAYDDTDQRWGTDFTHVKNYMDNFSLEQLRQIELAFERGEGGHRAAADNPDDRRAVKFASAVTTPLGRMRCIMQNIIDNGGTFNP